MVRTMQLMALDNGLMSRVVFEFRADAHPHPIPTLYNVCVVSLCTLK